MNTRLLVKYRERITIFEDGDLFRVHWKRYEGHLSMVSGPMNKERAEEV